MEAVEILPEDDAAGNGHLGHGPDRTETPPREDLEHWAAVIESLLFAAGAPVALAKLVDAIEGADRGEIVAALELLAGQYEDARRGLRLVKVAGGYQLRTPPEHGPWIRRLLGARPPRLSRPMLETLAIVAYRQPCTRVEIEAIRGVDADAVVTTLLERSMIRVVGRKEAPGRPLLYATTREFLEVFGLPDLSALPPLRALVDDPAVLSALETSIAAEGSRTGDEDGVALVAAAGGMAAG